MCLQDGTFKCTVQYSHYLIIIIIMYVFQESRLSFMSFWKACLNSSLNAV